MAFGNVVSAFGAAATGKQSTPVKNVGVSNHTELGYTSHTGDGSLIPPEYLVTINSTGLGVSVIGAMQDKLDMSVMSEWQPFVPGIPQILNVPTQIVFGRSLVSTFSSRRIWSGNSPLTMNLTLAFEAIDDAYINVVAPAMALVRMASPGDERISKNPVAGSFGAIMQQAERAAGLQASEFYLIPPGPSPQDPSKGDVISVQIGTAFTFDSVIIHSPKPSWDFSRVDENGWPGRVEVSLAIETYEIMTKRRIKGIVNR